MISPRHLELWELKTQRKLSRNLASLLSAENRKTCLPPLRISLNSAKMNPAHCVKKALHHMKRFTPRLILLVVIAAASQGAFAQSDLRDALKDSVGAHWIYDDFAQARARAKQTGQPLLVLFRCVP